MYSSQTELFSRDQWRERGRIVTAPNEEAKGVRNYWLSYAGLKRGAWHVFTEDQTVPVEQVSEAAA